MSFYLEKRSDGNQNCCISLFGMKEKFFVGKISDIHDIDTHEMTMLFLQKILSAKSYIFWKDKLRPAFQKELDILLYKNIYSHLQGEAIDTISYIQDFVYNSNKTEGSRIAKEDFLNVIKKKKTSYSNRNEIREIENSMKLRAYLQDGFIRNERSLISCYHILADDLLMESGKPYPKKAYKTHNIIVGNSVTLEPGAVQSAMKRLLLRYKEHKKKLFPLQLAIEFYYRFETIHPFTDGNGRIGRMLMNKILTQFDMIPLTIFAENRTAHFSAFEKSSIDYMVPMYEFMVEQYGKTVGG